MRVRIAEPRDARSIATIHVESWRGAYRGLVPDEHLDELSIDRRAAFWSEVLAHGPEWRQRTWIAERDGTPLGFATAGASRDPDLDRALFGELQAIYVDPEHWRGGAGRVLLEAAESFLREEGFVAATLWVLEGNERALGFYGAMGWRADGATKREVWDGVAMDEMRYRKELFSIRPVSSLDGPALGAIQLAVRPQLVVDFPPPHDANARGEMWTGYLSRPPVDDFRGWAAAIRDEVVAFAILGRETADTATIYDLYVAPACQRRGIGRALLDHALVDAREAGYRAASLWTGEASAAAAFYERLGWRATAREAADGGPLVRFEIAL
jgi:GNAT superfamily N-acetyltransferase